MRPSAEVIACLSGPQRLVSVDNLVSLKLVTEIACRGNGFLVAGHARSSWAGGR